MHLRLVLVLALAAATGCSRTQEPARSQEGPVLARVGEAVITPASLGEPEDLRTGAARRKRLEAAIARTLTAEEARRRGLAERPEIRARLAAVRRQATDREQAVLRDALFDDVRSSLAFSDEELRAHYAATRNRHVERHLRFRRIAYASRDEAERAHEQLGPGGRLDPDAATEIGPAPVRALPRTVVPDALRLAEPGKRMLVERDGTWALVELVEIVPAVPQPFEQVRDEVAASLATLRGQEAFRDLIAELRDEIGVEIDASVLADDAVWVAAEDGDTH